MPRTVKVAVIGSGLAGLTAAHLLNIPRKDDDVEFEVHVFEKSPSFGMDSSSISLNSPDHPQQLRIDVPMRSFQGGYYEQLIKLYKSLGIEFREADFTYSFSSLYPRQSEDRSIKTTFIYNGASGRAGFGTPSSFFSSVEKSQDTHVQRFWADLQYFIFIFRTVFCFLITLYHALPFRRPNYTNDIVFRNWVNRVAPKGLLARVTGMDVAWNSYVRMVLIPMFSAVCTSPVADVLDHPMEDFLDYIWLTFGTHHYVVCGGVCSVVARLSSRVKHVHLSSTVLSIKPDLYNAKCVSLSFSSNGQVEESSGFHHLVLATQAPVAARLLTTYLDSLQDGLVRRKESIVPLIQCLRAFESRPTVVINHTDNALLPDHDDDVRELNLITLTTEKESEFIHPPSSFCVPSTYTMATQVLRCPQNYSRNRPAIFQSTNPIIPPRKETIMSIAKLERGVVTVESRRALVLLCEKEVKKWWQCPYQAKTRLGPLQGARPTSEPTAPGIWICGSFAHLGIPLLEGCVITARNVVEQGILKSEGVRWMERL